MCSKQKAIIIIGTSLHDKQIQMIRQRDLKIIYFKNTISNYEVENVDLLEVMDLNNEDLVVEKAYELLENYDIETVFSINEYRVPLAAKVARAIGKDKRYLSYEAAVNCRNKKLTRKILNDKNISPVQCSLVRSVDEAMAVIQTFSFPVIVKPSNDSGSNLVLRCHNLYDLRYAISSIRHNKSNWAGQSYDTDILIEEFIGGQEYSVESCTIGGKTTIIGITEKLTTESNLSIETGQNFPAVLSEETKLEMCKVVTDAIEVLGIDYASTHTEVKLTTKGTKIIEVNCRPGHDRIHIIVEAVTGYNLRELSLHIALGGTFEDAPRYESQAQTASSRFLVAERDGIVNLSDVSLISSNPQIKEFEISLKCGDKIKQTTCNYKRYGHFVVLGTKDNDSKDIAEEILEKLDFKIN